MFSGVIESYKKIVTTEINQFTAKNLETKIKNEITQFETKLEAPIKQPFATTQPTQNCDGIGTLLGQALVTKLAQPTQIPADSKTISDTTVEPMDFNAYLQSKKQELQVKDPQGHYDSAEAIIKKLAKDPASIGDALEFVNRWFANLNDTDAIINNYHFVKPLFSVYRWQVRKFAEIFVLEIFNKNHVALEPAHIKWLTYSQKSLPFRLFSKTQDSIDTYNQISKGKSGDAFIATEKFQVTEEINQKLIEQHHEVRKFTFK